jgi:Ran GTPase-activating protein (RanGAP) involved in mRNA processing and transport
MPNLRELVLYHGWDFPLDKLAKNASLKNLCVLNCHPHALEGGDEPYIDLSHLRAVCKSPHLTALTHLHLHMADFGDAGITAIINSGILKRLKVLDLRHGVVTDDGANALAACPDLKNLQHLDLSWNRLTAEGVDALKRTGVNATLTRQQGPDAEQWETFSQGDYE